MLGRSLSVPFSGSRLFVVAISGPDEMYLRRFHQSAVVSDVFQVGKCQQRQLTGRNYQFLERSIIPTMHFQKSLPRLPVPKLEDGCRRYLRGLRPILTSQQFAKTERLVELFGANEGKELQTELEATDKANKHTSYISEPWFDMYLKHRDPICIEHNPFMAFSFDPDAPYNGQLIRATNLVISALRFKRSLDVNRLTPEIFHLNPLNATSKKFHYACRALPTFLSWYGAYLFKSYPLDMSQYSSLFNSTRIPQRGKDILQRFPAGKHIVVLKNGHFFAVKVVNADGTIRQPQEIFTLLNRIHQLPLPKPQHSIAVLSAQSRDKWADVREDLWADGNHDELHMIDSALFVLCLDDDDTLEPTALCKSLLHGDGFNRWFDKSFSFIVKKSGLAALQFEHSWGDGVAVLRLMEEVHKDTMKHHFVGPHTKTLDSVDVEKDVRELKFKFGDRSKRDIDEAMEEFKAFSGTVNFNTLEYEEMTKDDIKQAKLSPDAVMQLAIQLAYHMVHSKTVPTYESCSTAAFKHGRTETVRPATMETKAFVDAVRSAPVERSNDELRSLIKKCSDFHTHLVKEAAMGQGFDRQFFALRHIAEEKGRVPAIFKDEAYRIANDIILSTSTLSTNTVILGGFGPVTSHCYGIGYNVGDQRIGSTISTFKGGEVNGNQFAEALSSALNRIRTVIVGRK